MWSSSLLDSGFSWCNATSKLGNGIKLFANSWEDFPVATRYRRHKSLRHQKYQRHGCSSNRNQGNAGRHCTARTDEKVQLVRKILVNDSKVGSTIWITQVLLQWDNSTWSPMVIKLFLIPIIIFTRHSNFFITIYLKCLIHESEYFCLFCYIWLLTHKISYNIYQVKMACYCV